MNFFKTFYIILATQLCLNSLFAQSDTTEVEDPEKVALYNRVMDLDSSIRVNHAAQVSNFSPADTASLPIGIVKEIGQTKYIICIDSAYFTPQGAFFSVYMALDFPGATQKLAFAAKNIQFNPQGVIVSNGARLQLISRQAIKIGPNLEAVFKDDGKNFIEWDCNGYKQAGLSIDFVIAPNLIQNAINPTQPVTASLETVIADLKNITFTVQEITPFSIKGADDLKFHLQNVSIDRSIYTNPPDVPLPAYVQQTHAGFIEAWTGFYAQSAIITLPEKFKQGGSPTQIYASNLIIDDAGLTGSIGANNVFSIGNGGDASGWPFSLDNLSIDFLCNELTGGQLSGTLGVPVLDDSQLGYNASVSKRADSTGWDYNFIVSPAGQQTISAFSSSVTIHPSSYFELKSVNNKFIPKAVLNGAWTFTNSKGNFSGVSYQNLTITHQAPFVTNGTFALVSNNNENSKLVGFGISLTEIGMFLTPQNELAFGATVGMTVGSDGSANNFGVTAGFQVITSNNHADNRLEYDRFTVNDIGIESNVGPFNINGVISLRNDDPVFGDLFFGSLSFQINDLLDSPMLVSAGFGKKPSYKYWFVDASVPVQIPFAGNLAIKNIYGGVQNRVNSTFTDAQLIQRVTGQNANPPGNNIPFIPDNTQGLTFRAGVGIQEINDESIFNGEVLLAVSFNPNGGFAGIDLNGNAFMMVKRSDRTNANATKVFGNLAVSYNNNDKVLDASFNAGMQVPTILTGNLNIKMHISQDDWYFWLNRPTQRASLSLVNIFNVNTYFMVGTQIDPIPPPPAYVTNLVGAGNISNVDLNLAQSDGGFVTGMQFNTGVNGEFPKNTNWRGFVDVAVGGGFDLMLLKLAPTAHCSGSPGSKIGVNNYYCMGQVYAYLNGSLGARKYKDGELKNTYELGSIAMAALLQGKLPKPTYIYGAVALQVSILSVVNFGFDAEVEFGNNCNIVY